MGVLRELRPYSQINAVCLVCISLPEVLKQNAAVDETATEIYFSNTLEAGKSRIKKVT